MSALVPDCVLMRATLRATLRASLRALRVALARFLD
jgi:hypothetical protein